MRHLSRNTVVALGLAVLAALLTLLYVGSGKGKASTTKGASVQVLVATRDIRTGSLGTSLGGAVTLEPVSPGTIVTGALRTTGALRGLVSTQPIYAGEEVTIHRFARSTGNTSLAGLRGDQRVVEVEGDPTQLLDGTLQGGDHVDVVASVSIPEGSNHHESRIVLRDLRVLQAPTTSGSSSTTNDVSATLVVTDAQAATLFYVTKNADWSLLLRPSVRPADSNVPSNTAATVLGGQP